MNTLGKRAFSEAFPSDATFVTINTDTLTANSWIKTKRIYGDTNLTITTPADGTGGVIIEGHDGSNNALVCLYDIMGDTLKCNTVRGIGNLELQATGPGIITSVNPHTFLDGIDVSGNPTAINVPIGDTILKDVNANNIICQSVSGVNLNIFSVGTPLTLDAQGSTVEIKGDTGVNIVPAAGPINITGNTSGVTINASPGGRLQYNSDFVPRVRYVNTLGYNYSPLNTAFVDALPAGRFNAPFSFLANQFLLYSGFELEFQGTFTPAIVVGAGFNVEFRFGPTGTETLLPLSSQVFLGAGAFNYVCRIRGHMINATNMCVSGTLEMGRTTASQVIAAQTFSPAFDPTVNNLMNAVYASTNNGSVATTDYAKLTVIT